MTQVSDRELLSDLAAQPIGEKGLVTQSDADQLAHVFAPEATEAARRASKRWLPSGKRSGRSPAEREVERQIAANQIDLEDAVEAAGGRRGGISK